MDACVHNNSTVRKLQPFKAFPAPHCAALSLIRERPCFESNPKTSHRRLHHCPLRYETRNNASIYRKRPIFLHISTSIMNQFISWTQTGWYDPRPTHPERRSEWTPPLYGHGYGGYGRSHTKHRQKTVYSNKITTHVVLAVQNSM